MATYYISTTGNDNTGNGSIGLPWKTLKKATTVVTTFGDIIHVNPGTYTETQQCFLSRGVSIEGDSYITTIIKSSLTGTFSTFLELNSSQNTNGNQHISGITLDGQYISEANFKTWIGIWVTGRSNVHIYDCKIINWRDRGIIFKGVDETDSLSDPGNHATGNKIYNCIIDNSAQNAGAYGAGCVNIGGQEGMEIYNNTITQTTRPNFKNGWPIKYWDNGWLKGVKIYNNTLKKAPYQGTYPGENGDWSFAIELFNIQGLEIYNNTIQGSIDLNYNYKGSYPFSMWIHDNIISHDVQNTKVEDGIILEFRTESAIIENNIFKNKTSGISFNTRGPANTGGYDPVPGGLPGGYSYLVNNVIKNNAFYNLYQGSGIGNRFAIGVISEGTDDPQINNMQIYNNTAVVKSGDAIGIGLDFTSQPNGNCTGLYIKNNILEGFTSAAIQGTSGAGNTNINTCQITHNNIRLCGNGNAPLWPGGNPVNYTYNNTTSVNPLFISTTDFHLQAGSPMIDTGINVGLPYSGSAPDRGAYEYVTITNTPPTANAGADQTITLPTSSTTLSGSGSFDIDGTITGYLWTRISGPNTPTIVSPNGMNTNLTGLIAGTYVYQLQVTDDDGATGTDQISIIVNAAPALSTMKRKSVILSGYIPIGIDLLASSYSDSSQALAAYATANFSPVTIASTYNIGTPNVTTIDIALFTATTFLKETINVDTTSETTFWNDIEGWLFLNNSYSIIPGLKYRLNNPLKDTYLLLQ